MNEHLTAPRTDAPSPAPSPETPPPADNACSLEEAPAPLGVYQIEFEGDARIVEATSMRDAIEIWKHHQALTHEVELSDVDEPSSCNRIDSLPALRWVLVSSMRGRELEIDEDGCTVRWHAGELTRLEAGDQPDYAICAPGYVNPGEMRLTTIRHSEDDLLDLAAAIHALLGVRPSVPVEKPEGVAADVIQELLAFVGLVSRQLPRIATILDQNEEPDSYVVADIISSATTLLAQAERLRQDQADTEEGGAA